jgi:predicted nicotinamide N-methyase
VARGAAARVLTLKLDLVEEEIELAGRRVRLQRPRSPEALLDDAVASGELEAPYWAELWPAARALAAYVSTLDLEGRRVVELGCGLALPSLAAALGGADVLATDIVSNAVALARHNGRRILGRRLPAMKVDVWEPPDELFALAPFDLVLAADVLYLPELAGHIGRVASELAPEGLISFAFRDQETQLVDGLLEGVTIEVEPLPVPPPGPMAEVWLARLSRA